MHWSKYRRVGLGWEESLSADSGETRSEEVFCDRHERPGWSDPQVLHHGRPLLWAGFRCLQLQSQICFHQWSAGIFVRISCFQFLWWQIWVRAHQHGGICSFGCSISALVARGTLWSEETTALQEPNHSGGHVWPGTDGSLDQGV